MRLLFVVIIILGVTFAYGTPYSWLFWAALINMITYLIIVLAIPNVVAAKAMKRFKSKVEDSSRQGATDEGINIMLDEDIPIVDSDEQSVTNWIYLIGFINIVVGVIIFIASILIRLM